LLPQTLLASIDDCYCSLTPDPQVTEAKEMKTPISSIFVVMMCTAQAFAASSQQIGAWSVTQATDNRAVLIQTVSEHTKLDLICRNGKVWKVALETSDPVQERAVDFNRGIPTTRMGFRSDLSNSAFEDWAIADGGKTLFAHSDMFEGRLDRRWIERLSSSPTIRFSFDTQDSTFKTGELAQALESAGCTY
jgi:hypothetical protein